jgi:small ligand-binding sensory domain FIST
MKWGSAITHDEGNRRYGGARQYIADVVEKVQFQLSGQVPDFAVLFISPHFQQEYEHVCELLKKELGASHFIGCSAGGLIGGGIEVERQKAVALTAAVLPGVDIKTFHLEDEDLPDLDDGPTEWEKLIGSEGQSEPGFILLPDPFTFPIDTLVQGLDFAFPRSVKLGGLASGANRPGANALFCDNKLYRTGAVGACISGNVMVDAVVAQGCRPIGKTYSVTKCQNNFLMELDGKPAVHALKDVLESLPETDRELARNSLFLGVVMDEFKDDFKVGDFLVRNILSIEPRTGSLIIGEILRNERRVQFHLRDAATSSDDLKMMLKRYAEQHVNDGGTEAAGALLFSCLGRGKHLYGEANHDSDCFRQYLGEVPLGGFFCNGEIGPVGGTTFLHGYTSSFGIFREKLSAGGS